jgi:4-oxalocrotonate tautomerase
VERLTDAIVSIEGENMRSVTWVVVEEVKSGDWGIGGNALTTDAVRSLAAGSPVASRGGCCSPVRWRGNSGSQR